MILESCTKKPEEVQPIKDVQPLFKVGDKVILNPEHGDPDHRRKLYEKAGLTFPFTITEIRSYEGEDSYSPISTKWVRFCLVMKDSNGKYVTFSSNAKAKATCLADCNFIKIQKE